MDPNFYQVTDPNPEEAANLTSGDKMFKSGGGFSNFIARPSFQDAAVQHYIDNYTGNLPDTAFNRSGRAYPDVSANGCVLNSRSCPVYGDFCTC